MHMQHLLQYSPAPIDAQNKGRQQEVGVCRATDYWQVFCRLFRPGTRLTTETQREGLE